MRKIIDLCLGLPPDEESFVKTIKLYVLGEGDRGLLGYRYTFGPKISQQLGTTLEELDQMAKELTYTEFEDLIREKARKTVTPLEKFVEELDTLGVTWGVMAAEDRDNDKTAAVVARYPEKFVGQAFINPHEGMNAVRELERAVKELGLTSLYVSSYRYHIPCNDKKFYPLYKKAVELGIPVFIYTSMNLNTALPIDIAHPRNVDEVARAFPELNIIAALGGWPWVPEMIGVALRNQNVMIDTEVQRPKNFAIPGSGWEMLLQFGNTLLQDRIAFASKWESLGVSLQTVINEVLELPLKDEVKEKWLYKNAAKLFNRV